MPFDPNQRADGPHRGQGTPLADLGPAGGAPTVAESAAPSAGLGHLCPAAVERLEHLDDVVFDAVAGRQQALEELQTLWPQILRQLGTNLVEESRVQYMRHAVEMWQECAAGDGVRSPQVAMAAMNVIEILMATPR